MKRSNLPRLLSFLAVLCLIFTAGCESGAKDSPGSEETQPQEEDISVSQKAPEQDSVSALANATKSISALTDKEANTLCTHLDETNAEFHRQDAVRQSRCLISGAEMVAFDDKSDDENATNCEQHRQDCLAGESSSVDFSFIDHCFAESDRAQCQVSVETFNHCFGAVLDRRLGGHKNVLDSSCSELVAHDLDEMRVNYFGRHDFYLEECEEVVDNCNGLYNLL